MAILTSGTGIVLVVSSKVSMSRLSSRNEWRVPLWDLNAELNGISFASEKRNLLFAAVFFYVLFGVRLATILGVVTPSSHRNIPLLVLGILLVWLLRGSYVLIRPLDSAKTSLLNYLFSPYLFVWRLDYLSKYSDDQIAIATCRICNIHDTSFIDENTSLKDFLVALHRKTRAAIEHDFHPNVLQENIALARRVSSR